MDGLLIISDLKSTNILKRRKKTADNKQYLQKTGRLL